jgi:uncharacterized membrane protein YebE (DUF533 family)
MINAQSLLDRFLGQGMTAQPPSSQPQAGVPTGSAPPGQLDLAGAARQALSGAGGLGGLAASGVAGGLLGLLVGGKKKSMGGLGGMLSHGGAAMIGALASRAFQGWQKGQAPAQTPAAQSPQSVPVEQRYLPAAAPAADGKPFELALVRAMIGAAKSDGHIDAEEQDRIFARVGEAGLDAESKAFVFDALATPVSVSDIAALATTPEQAAELYLVSRLAIDPDRPAELAYLQALAHRLNLPDDLVAHLNRQIEIS